LIDSANNNRTDLRSNSLADGRVLDKDVIDTAVERFWLATRARFLCLRGTFTNDRGIGAWSEDGINFRIHRENFSNGLFPDLTRVIWAQNQFVACGSSWGVRTSPDGYVWTQRSAANYGRIAFGNGWYLASYINSRSIYRSTDLVNWTEVIPANIVSGAGITAIFFHNNNWLIGTSVGIYRSTDNGVNWTRVLDTVNLRIHALAYGNNTFVALRTPAGSETATQTITPLTSPDGITWTARNGVTNWGRVGNMIFAGGQFVAVGSTINTSPDGITWTRRTAAGGYTDIAYGLNRYVAAGASSFGSTENGRIAHSPDGITWTVLSNLQPGNVSTNSQGFSAVCFSP